MTKPDKQKLSIFVVLLAVLALTIVLGYRMTQPAAVVGETAAEQTKTSQNPPAANDAKIRLDLVENPEAAGEDIGKRNVFQYRQTPPPTAVERSGGRSGGPFTPSNSESNFPPTSVRPQGPPQPAPPPPIPLKYQGFAADKKPGGGFTAFLADDTRHYNVTVGEVLMGRYRILSISDNVVDVEDLEFNRRQSLPRIK
jgi:hypothetical protein